MMYALYLGWRKNQFVRTAELIQNNNKRVEQRALMSKDDHMICTSQLLKLISVILSYMKYILQQRLNHKRMLSKVINQVKSQMSIKNKLKQKLAQFLTVDAGAVLRNTPTSKQRKYINVEIAEDFKRMDDKRKKQRYENMKKRQHLLQQKLKNEGKLLTASQSQSISTQIKQISNIIKQQAKQIQKLDAVIDSTEATHVLIEGIDKLVVLNHISYLKYLHTHNPGFTLHPETIKAIQNVHYCVNHNLPVNRIKLYEIMPHIFKREIGELEESVRKLIAEKKIYIEDEESKSSVRFFERLNEDVESAMDGYFIIEKTEDAFRNVYDHCLDLLRPHEQLVMRVHSGKTPFRSVEHMDYVMLSDMPIKYLPEEQAYRKDLLKVHQFIDEWRNYKALMNQKYVQYKHRYLAPPPYIANHPMLNEKWEKFMVNYTNPQSIQGTEFTQIGDMSQVELGDKMTAQLQKISRQKFDPIFIEAMNNDRSSLDKKKLQIQFYTMATNVLQKFKALQDKSKDQQQIFQKMPKDNKSLFLTQRKKSLLRMNEITRIIFLNNKDKNKYNLEFFSQWFGVEKIQLQKVLRSISYLRVPKQEQKKNIQDVQFSIIKFQI